MLKSVLLLMILLITPAFAGDTSETACYDNNLLNTWFVYPPLIYYDDFSSYDSGSMPFYWNNISSTYTEKPPVIVDSFNDKTKLLKVSAGYYNTVIFNLPFSTSRTKIEMKIDKEISSPSYHGYYINFYMNFYDYEPDFRFMINLAEKRIIYYQGGLQETVCSNCLDSLLNNLTLIINKMSVSASINGYSHSIPEGTNMSKINIQTFGNTLYIDDVNVTVFTEESAPCCGDDGVLDYFRNDTHYCFEGVSYDDPDNSQGACLLNNSFNTWFTGLIQGSTGACCGDDSVLEYFRNETHYCSQGKIYVNPDRNEGACYLNNSNNAWINGTMFNEGLAYGFEGFYDNNELNNFVENQPRFLVSGDFDNDGKHDLIINNYYNSLVFFKGDGNGNFTKLITTGLSFNINSIDSGDFNNDGKLDLVIGTSNGFTFFAGNGLGGFSQGASYSTTNYSPAITSGDFNNDGNLDVIVSRGNTYYCAFFIGNGNGGFSRGTDLYAIGVGNVYLLDSGDFNNDGNLDLIASQYSNPKIFNGNGLGGFTQGPVLNMYINKLKINDVNNDGNADYISGSSYELNIYLGNGNNGYYEVINKPTIDDYRIETFSVNDFNLDGIKDIVTIPPYGNISVFKGMGFNGPYCCGDDGVLDTFNNKTAFCNEGISFSDADDMQELCFASNPSYTWFTGEITEGLSPCCGDDGMLDLFRNETHYCYKGLSYTDTDLNQDLCLMNSSSNTWFTGKVSVDYFDDFSNYEEGTPGFGFSGINQVNDSILERTKVLVANYATSFDLMKDYTQVRINLSIRGGYVYSNNFYDSNNFYFNFYDSTGSYKYLQIAGKSVYIPGSGYSWVDLLPSSTGWIDLIIDADVINKKIIINGNSYNMAFNNDISGIEIKHTNTYNPLVFIDYIQLISLESNSSIRCCGDDGVLDNFYNASHVCNQGLVEKEQDYARNECVSKSNTWFDGVLYGFNGACCGDDEMLDYFHNSSLYCVNGLVYDEADDSEYLCKLNNVKNTWLYNSAGINSACCGDDGVLDTFNNGTHYCLEGVYYDDIDNYKEICEFLGFKWFTDFIYGTGGRCCGDDVNEYFLNYSTNMQNATNFCYDSKPFYFSKGFDGDARVCDYFGFNWTQGTIGNYASCCGDDGTLDHFTNATSNYGGYCFNGKYFYGNLDDYGTGVHDWTGIAMSSLGNYQTGIVNKGNVYVSSDYGITWSPKASVKDWNSVSMSDDGKYQTAVVNGGRVWVSSDYGLTWIESNSIIGSWTGVSVSGNGNYQAAVVNGGRVWVSSDYGLNWLESNSIIGEWTGISMSYDGKNQTGIISGGNVYVSSDYGITWSPKASVKDWSSVEMGGVINNIYGCISKVMPFCGSQVFTRTRDYSCSSITSSTECVSKRNTKNEQTCVWENNACIPRTVYYNNCTEGCCTFYKSQNVCKDEYGAYTDDCSWYYEYEYPPRLAYAGKTGVTVYDSPPIFCSYTQGPRGALSMNLIHYATGYTVQSRSFSAEFMSDNAGFTNSSEPVLGFDDLPTLFKIELNEPLYLDDMYYYASSVNLFLTSLNDGLGNNSATYYKISAGPVLVPDYVSNRTVNQSFASSNRTGVFDYSIAFDGYDDFIVLRDDYKYELKNNFTVSLWFNKKGSGRFYGNYMPNPDSRVLLAKPLLDHYNLYQLSGDVERFNFFMNKMYSSNFIFRITDDNTLYVDSYYDTDSGINSVTLSNSVSDGWNNAVLVFETNYPQDGAVFKLYVNSELVQSQTVFSKAKPLITNGGIHVGGLLLGDNYRISDVSLFDGMIDDVRIYKKALNNNEIINLTLMTSLPGGDVCPINDFFKGSESKSCYGSEVFNCPDEGPYGLRVRPSLEAGNTAYPFSNYIDYFCVGKEK